MKARQHSLMGFLFLFRVCFKTNITEIHEIEVLRLLSLYRSDNVFGLHN